LTQFTANGDETEKFGRFGQFFGRSPQAMEAQEGQSMQRPKKV